MNAVIAPRKKPSLLNYLENASFINVYICEFLNKLMYFADAFKS